MQRELENRQGCGFYGFGFGSTRLNELADSEMEKRSFLYRLCTDIQHIINAKCSISARIFNPFNFTGITLIVEIVEAEALMSKGVKA